MKRKIVVIGSNSFSGSDFIDLLLEDPENRVIGMSRSPEKTSVFLPYKRHTHPHFSFHQMDLNSDMEKIIAVLEEQKPHYIINFAAQSEVAPSWDHPEHWYETNTVSLARLINFIKDAKYLKRYVHISSPEVYGTCEGVVKEDGLINPSTPYAASKAAADLLLFTYVKNFNFPLVMIRSTNVYGAHQQLFKIIPRTVINLKLNQPIELHGGGVAVKSYIHIRDISRGELAAMEKGKNGEIYHLSPDAGVAVKDVVAMICQKMGKDVTKMIKVVAERLGQDKAYIIDSTKARNMLGWRPIITLEDGLTGVIEWINDEWNEISNLPRSYIHKA